MSCLLRGLMNTVIYGIAIAFFYAPEKDIRVWFGASQYSDIEMVSVYVFLFSLMLRNLSFIVNIARWFISLHIIKR
jgi:hypothetical protein